MTTAPATAAAPPRAPGTLERPAVAFALLVAALFATANIMGLFEPTETRYAEIAREMRVTGDYLVPHLDGIAHLHKPPVAYWAVALGQALLGDNGWGVRIPVALATLGTLFFAWTAFRRRFGALGVPPVLALWALGTMVLPFLLGRTAATDPFLAESVAAFWAFAPSTWAIVWLAIGFFAKGPVVFVPTLLPVLVAAMWGRDRGTLRLLGPARAWLAFVAIALPWYVIVTLRVPGLMSYLLENQLWARYATHVHHRSGPPWYFLGVLAAGSLPWTAAMIAGFRRVASSAAREESRLLYCWVFAPLVFFSFSGSKLPSYLLPCFPAIALFATAGLDGGRRPIRVAVAATLAALVVAAATLGPRALARSAGVEDAAAPLPPLVWAALALWSCAAVWMLGGRTAHAALFVLAGYVAVVSGLARYEGALGSPRPLASVLAESRSPGEPIVEYERFNSGLPFYLGEHVRLLDVERELFFTPGNARHEVLITADSLPPLARRHGRVWLLTPSGDGERLAASVGLDYRRVTRWRRLDLGTVESRPSAR